MTPEDLKAIQRAALAVHDAEARWEALVALAEPALPAIADPDAPTGDERDACRDALAAARATRDQRDAARTDLDQARAAFALTYRLAGGADVDADGASQLAHVVVRLGAAALA